MILGGSPVLSFPDSKSWREAYKKLDCLIVLDRYFTEDTRYADVVFPACSLFEVPKAVPGPEGPHIVEPLIEPVGESKNDVLIMGAIAKKLGFGDKLPQTEEELRAGFLVELRHMQEILGQVQTRKKKSIIRNMRQVS